jgi:hypothetical protein
MRTSVAALALLSLAACKFDRSAESGVAQAPASPAPTAAGGGSPLVPDASEPVADASGSAGAAATPMDSGMDAAPPARDDAGLGDGGAFGNDPTPQDPVTPPQTGGLKCADVFCPFATQPIEPCCTDAEDVERGAARMPERCGLSFAATGADFFGDLCWQRDQPGVVDDSCPSVAVDVQSEEPGCCSDQGVCGSINTEHALGCHGDPTAEAQSCGGTQTPPDPTAQCDPRGVYSLRVKVDLAWGGRSGGLWNLTDDGRGTQLVQLLVHIDSVDPTTLELQGTARACGVEMPTFFSTTLCEAYRPIFPAAMWESDAMPSFPISGRFQCLEPGCIATIDAQTSLLGIELDNPEAPWPLASDTPDIECATGDGVECFPDHDGDGRPGLSVQVVTEGMATGGTGCSRRGYELKAAPLSASIAAIVDGVRRTDRVLLGVRMKVGGSVTLGEECAAGTGSGIAEFVNSRAWGCYVQAGTYNYPRGQRAGANTPCSSQEAAFMDANLPIYDILAVGERPDSDYELRDTSPSSGPQISLVRLGGPDADVSCEDVRSAAHP